MGRGCRQQNAERFPEFLPGIQQVHIKNSFGSMNSLKPVMILNIGVFLHRVYLHFDLTFITKSRSDFVIYHRRE